MRDFSDTTGHSPPLRRRLLSGDLINPRRRSTRASALFLEGAEAPAEDLSTPEGEGTPMQMAVEQAAMDEAMNEDGLVLADEASLGTDEAAEGGLTAGQR